MSGTWRKVHFNALPTSMRRRFVESLALRGEPRPIASYPETATAPAIGWALFALAGLVGFGVALGYEFARSFHPVLGVEYVLAYVASLFVFLHGSIACVRSIVRARSLPFVPGRYVFPLDIVIARGSEIEWVPTGAIGAVNTTHHHRNGVYTGSGLVLSLPDGRKESFWLPTKEEPTRILRGIGESHDQVHAAIGRGDLEPVRALDLFFEIRGAKELEDPVGLASFRATNERDGEAPLTTAVSQVFERSSLVALALAVVIGIPTWWLRNRLSDDDAFAGLPTAPRYEVEGYLRSGGRHVEEARTVVLPAVAFREATRQRSATALRAFLAEFPNAPQASEARAAIHTLYDEAFAAFVASAPSDPRLLSFMRGLLTHLESSESPTVVVRFFPPSNEALAEEDVALARRGRREAGHDVSPIAPYFGGEGASALEAGVTTRLDAGFARVFAADVFHLTHGGRIVGAEADPSVAALDVRYVVRPSGALYVSDSDQRAFVGIHVDFAVLMRAPETTATYEFALQVEPPDTFSVSYRDGDHASESNIYATMTERAFDRLADGLSATFFSNVAAGNETTGTKPPTTVE